MTIRGHMISWHHDRVTLDMMDTRPGATGDNTCLVTCNQDSKWPSVHNPLLAVYHGWVMKYIHQGFHILLDQTIQCERKCQYSMLGCIVYSLPLPLHCHCLTSVIVFTLWHWPYPVIVPPFSIIVIYLHCMQIHSVNVQFSSVLLNLQHEENTHHSIVIF